jgi:hypothetical protein
MKKNIQGKGYNKGDQYEDKITNILINKKILPEDYKRAGASNRSDIEIIYKKKKYKIEVKNKSKGADYGQKELKWSPKKKFYWTDKNPNDPIVKLYYDLNIIEKYIDKNFIPRRYSKKLNEITNADKKYDLKMCEKTVKISLDALFLYYKNKNCFYIQVEKSGIYYLAQDIHKLGVPRYDGEIGLRLRAKTRSSKKPYMYGLLGKIALLKKPTTSKFDIEELDERKFPFV